MRINVQMCFTDRDYEIQSMSTSYYLKKESVCVQDGNGRFLGVGESLKNTAGGVTKEELEAAGVKLTEFNPFNINSFEPEKASLVIRYYISLIHLNKHKEKWKIIQNIIFMFIDKYEINIIIPAYEKIKTETRQRFENAVLNNGMVESITVNHGVVLLKNKAANKPKIRPFIRILAGVVSLLIFYGAEIIWKQELFYHFEYNHSFKAMISAIIIGSIFGLVALRGK